MELALYETLLGVMAEESSLKQLDILAWKRHLPVLLIIH